MNKKNASEKVIGVKAINYNEKRNFAGLQISGFKFKKVLDFYRVISFFYFKIRGKTHPFWLNLFNNFYLGQCDIYHFWNATSSINVPWIVTFECFLPRGAHQFGFRKNETRYIHKTIGRLVNSSCKRIIATSQYAYNSQQKYMDNYGKLKHEVLSKIVILHPSQELFINNLTEKNYVENKIRFVLVGADFFRKGGMEVLKAFNSVCQEFSVFELVIISKLDYGDYASYSDECSRLEAMKLIQSNPQIVYFQSLKNNEVLEYFKRSHVGLLPSYDETYGYSVLEAQSCGCPVVTTNGGAFCEINNNDCGWIIKLPLPDGLRTIPTSLDQKREFSSLMTSELIRIFQEIGHNPSLIKQKGERSLERIKKFHDVKKTTEKLKEIYLEALQT